MQILLKNKIKNPVFYTNSTIIRENSSKIDFKKKENCPKKEQFHKISINPKC